MPRKSLARAPDCGANPLSGKARSGKYAAKRRSAPDPVETEIGQRSPEDVWNITLEDGFALTKAKASGSGTNATWIWGSERGFDVSGRLAMAFSGRHTRLRDITPGECRISEAMILGDALAGLRYLANRPHADPTRICVIGFSYARMITVLAAYEQLARDYLPQGPRFRSHVSYYGCSIPPLDDPATTGAPVTQPLGASDRNVFIPRVQEIVGDLRRGGSESQVQGSTGSTTSGTARTKRSDSSRSTSTACAFASGRTSRFGRSVSACA